MMSSVKGNVSRAITQRIESRDFSPMVPNDRITIQALNDLFLSITKATEYLGFSTTQYTRRLLKAGTIAGVKVRTKGNRTRWFLHKETLREYHEFQIEKRRMTRYIVKMPSGLLPELKRWLSAQSSDAKGVLCSVYPQADEKRKRTTTPVSFLDSLDLD